MDLSRCTQKCQEAFHEAQALAARRGHQEVDSEHLLSALISQKEGLAPRFLERMGVDLNAFSGDLDDLLAKRPSVSGSGIEAGKVYISQKLHRALISASDEAGRLKDDYVSVEHLLLGIIESEEGTALGKLLSSYGINKNSFLNAMTEIRGNQRVSGENPEGP